MYGPDDLKRVLYSKGSGNLPDPTICDEDGEFMYPGTHLLVEWEVVNVEPDYNYGDPESLPPKWMICVRVTYLTYNYFEEYDSSEYCAHVNIPDLHELLTSGESLVGFVATLSQDIDSNCDIIDTNDVKPIDYSLYEGVVRDNPYSFSKALNDWVENALETLPTDLDEKPLHDDSETHGEPLFDDSDSRIVKITI
jgi:hypothetical protein